jgi:hypothetical protein
MRFVATPTRKPVFIEVADERLSFVGGLNTRSSRVLAPDGTPYALRRDQCTILENFDRNESGQLIGRFGTEKIHQVQLTPARGGPHVTSLYEYRRRNGTVALMATCGNGVFRLNVNAALWDLIGEIPTYDQLMWWVTFGDLAYFISEGNKLLKYDDGGVSPTSVAPVADYPVSGATAIEVYRRRIFTAFGLNLYFCALGNAADWTSVNNAGSIPVDFVRSTRINGLFAFYNQLIVWGDDEFGRIIGTSPDPASESFFRYEKISSRYGHHGGPGAVIAADNDVLFQERQAVRKLFTVQATPEVGDIREEAESVNIENVWGALSDQNMPNRFAVDMTTKQQVIFAVGEHSPNNQVAYVADYRHKDSQGHMTWAKYFPFAFSCGIEARKIWTERTVLLGGYDGFVYRMSAVETDNGNPIFCRAQFISDMGYPGWEKTFRYMILLITPPDALQGETKYLGSNWVLGVDPLGEASNFIARCSWDFGSRTILQQSVGLKIPGNMKKLGVDWVMGVDPLGAAALIRPRVAIPGHGRDVEVTLEYNGSRRIRIAGAMLYGSLRRMIT